MVRTVPNNLPAATAARAVNVANVANAVAEAAIAVTVVASALHGWPKVLRVLQR